MAFLEYRPITPLFHYCSPGAFYGVAETGTIWLSDLQCANDPKELQLAAVIETLMHELIRDQNTPAPLRVVYEALAPHLQRHRRQFGFYSFSTSLNGDHLPMWQEYTERGRGFCIAFRPTAFNDMPLRVQKVKYVSPDYFGLIHRQVDAIVSPLVGFSKNQIFQIMTYSEILSLITSVKNEIWQHEGEVRLVFSCTVRPTDFEAGKILPISQLPDGSPVLPEEPLYRNRNGQRVPYYVKPFGRLRCGKWDASNAIEKVIIGQNSNKSVNEVKEYLQNLGYKNFEVSVSRCEFR